MCSCSRDRTCCPQLNTNTLRPPVNSIPTMFKVINSGVCRKIKPFILRLSRVQVHCGDQQKSLQVETSANLLTGLTSAVEKVRNAGWCSLWVFYLFHYYHYFSTIYYFSQEPHLAYKQSLNYCLWLRNGDFLQTWKCWWTRTQYFLYQYNLWFINSAPSPLSVCVLIISINHHHNQQSCKEKGRFGGS